MNDWIGVAASVVTVAGGAVAIRKWLAGRSRPTVVPHRHAHRGLQTWPVSFLIQRHGDIPTVEVTLLAVNYLNKQLQLRELKIGRLSASGLPALDTIPLANEVDLEPYSARFVVCSRRLVDTEAMVIAGVHASVASGAVNLVARGVARGKEIPYVASGISVDGRILPEQPRLPGHVPEPVRELRLEVELTPDERTLLVMIVRHEADEVGVPFMSAEAVRLNPIRYAHAKESLEKKRLIRDLPASMVRRTPSGIFLTEAGRRWAIDHGHA